MEKVMESHEFEELKRVRTLLFALAPIFLTTRVETLAMQTTTLPNNSFARTAHFFVHFFIVTAPPRRENVYFHVLWRT